MLILISGCNINNTTQNQNIVDNSTQTPQYKINVKTALDIAKTDHKIHYGSLENFNVKVIDDGNRWLVKFTNKNPAMNGGGADYIIDKISGEILQKKAYQ